jgi:quercetin dioxygenase-like cupin family protein
MIKAWHLYTGADGHSHVVSGTILSNHEVVAAGSIHFEETPAHSALDWHTAPATQYVITLSGTLEFVTRTGESFTIHPGEILVAMDTTGTGHKWRLIDDQPWKRVYVTFKEGTDMHFRADETGVLSGAASRDS